MNILINTKIPQNSWLLNLTDRTALIGTNVSKISDSEFYEGGWAHTISPFSESDTCLRFGSGFVVKRDQIVIYSPSHTLESIYTLQHDDEFLISNSLAFLMSQFKNFIFKDDFKMKDIARLIWRSTEGVKHYPRQILKNNHVEINRYLFCKLEISKDFKVSEITYKTPFDFKDFTSYKNFLVETISQAAINSNAVEIASYLSKGYDSVACTALARQAGGNLTFSVKTSRDGIDDSGANIAKQLGMKTIEFNRKERKLLKKDFDWGSTNFEILTHDEDHNYEFFVGLNFEDEVLHIDYDLQDHVVLTGFNGDKLWGMGGKPTENLERGETSGSSIYEFRLRKGFVHIPVPLILLQINPNIQSITNSDEMKGYVIPETDYNRPIPRRIAEEMGVDRSQFGVKKTAASTMVENLDNFRDQFFEKLMKRYEV